MGVVAAAIAAAFFSFFSFAFAAWNKLAAHATGKNAPQRAIGSGAEIAFRLRFRCAPGIVRNGLPFAIFLLIIRFCGTVFRHCLLHFRQRVRRFGFAAPFQPHSSRERQMQPLLLRGVSADDRDVCVQQQQVLLLRGCCRVLCPAARGAFGCCFLCDVFSGAGCSATVSFFLRPRFSAAYRSATFRHVFLFGSGSSRTVDSLLIEDSVDKFFFLSKSIFFRFIPSATLFEVGIRHFV